LQSQFNYLVGLFFPLQQAFIDHSISMRVLHARPDLLGGGAPCGGKGENRR
jgi:hypothetical protein